MENITINGQKIGVGQPTYVIAEISANHNHDIQEAIDLINIAAECGADAVKIQTYTADTMTLDCDNDYFKIGKGTLWAGKNMYQLYKEAYTPWDWTPRLLAVAELAGITLFSTPFDSSSVDYLESVNVPAHKIASFELTDLPLIKKIAQTGKPVIMSTGMGSLLEITEAVETLRNNGCKEFALLKCTSAYPAPAEEANLARILHMSQAFEVPVGLSDHTMGSTVPALAVALGASIVEKHFTKSRDVPGPDSAFSLEPGELKEMIDSVRIAEKAVGRVTYDLTEQEKKSRSFRRSIFVSEDVKKGDIISHENVRVIRPGHGIAPKYLEEIIGKTFSADVDRGTPFTKDYC